MMMEKNEKEEKGEEKEGEEKGEEDEGGGRGGRRDFQGGSLHRIFTF